MLSSNERRNKILEKLSKVSEAITGTELAKIFNVSRQVIVQDIAILRASGVMVMSTPQGYILSNDIVKKTRVLVSSHNSIDEIEDELYTIVDLGGKVLDVIVEHPIYGEICARLMISSRYQVDQFISKIKEHRAEPLARLTGGMHLHTIEADNEEMLDKIEVALKSKGYTTE